MTECIACSATNIIDSKFCIICGCQLNKECKKCKTKLPVIANFCNNCGTTVNSEVEESLASKKVS